jgi:Uma2 family endonuclease
MALEMQRHLLTLDQFEEMVRVGIIAEDARVELIEGELIDVPPPSPQHATVTRRLTRDFYAAIGDRAVIDVQDAIRLPPRSAPQPDITLAMPPDTRYEHKNPEPPDILLVVEVSRTTHDYDRRTKMPLYARQGVREAWLVDEPGRIVEVYRDPGPDGYRQMTTIDEDGSLSPEAFPDVEIAVGPLFPAQQT